MLRILLYCVPIPPMMASVTPHATPHTTLMPPLTASANLSNINLPPLPHPTPTPTPTPPYCLCADILPPPGPPSVTPHTTLPGQQPVWSAGAGGGAASFAPALLGPHSQPAASTSFRSLPGLHCRGVCINTHQVILGASYTQAVVATAYTSLLNETRASWCCMLHLKASWGCIRTDCCLEDKTCPACTLFNIRRKHCQRFYIVCYDCHCCDHQQSPHHHRLLCIEYNVIASIKCQPMCVLP